MSNHLLWKWVLILVVVGAAVWFAYPPQEKTNLGLDLQGGAHILLVVDTSSALKHYQDLAVTRIGQTLKDNEVPYDSIKGVGVATIEVTVPAGQEDQAEDLVKAQAGDWRMTSIGTGAWRLTMPAELQAYYTETALETTRDILEKRVDSLGLKEPTIARQGLQGERILVQLPGVEDVNQIKDYFEEPAKLEWKAVTYPPGVSDPAFWGPAPSEEALIAQFGGVLPDDTEIYPQVEINEFGEETGNAVYYPLKRVSTVAGDDLKNARRDMDDWGNAIVIFELTQDAARRFEVATRENLKKQMAIVLDDVVLSAPEIKGVIRDQGKISGGFTVESAEKLAVQLRSGAMPVDISIEEERTVGPSLGRDSIRAGVMAATFGFLLVLAFMVIYYRLSGINAVVALALNILLVLGAMAYFEATLTLPGIAGLVLVVGMAVDSNVLIFERIREELRIGKTVRSAVDQGFRTAFRTILDCNVTTLVAAFFLFSYGTGPVKGFAVTLVIGLLASMFTAVFVSRQIFELVLSGRKRVESLSI